MPTKNTFKNLVYLTRTRGLFIGHIPPLMRSAQASPVLLVNLLGQFVVDIAGNEVKSKTILLKAGMEIDVTSRDLLVADFMLDRFAGDYVRLEQQMSINSGGVYFGLKGEQVIADILLNIYEHEFELKESLRLLTGYFDHYTQQAEPPVFDARIRKIVDLICAKPFENYSLEELSDKVNLSIPRLVELFKHEMGVPIRKYRMWRRFFSACESIATHSNITEAAHAAGFSDSAHFSRNFCDMFGVNPRAIFRPETKIIIKSS